MYNHTLIYILLLWSSIAISQDHLEIQALHFSGNKKTKEHVIRNELNFSEGDSILLTELDKFIERNEKILESIGLFNAVNINVQNLKGSQGDLLITVNENLYLFPAPILEFADRNFNVWWQEQNRSLNRLNYGARLRHYNLTGNKDPALIVLQFGYTRKFEFKYGVPYLNKEKNLGFYSSIFYSDNREIPYITEGNKSLFYKHEDERIMLKRYRASVRLSYRPEPQKHHSLSLEFHKNSVDDFVIQELNPDYFLEGQNSLKFFMINYDAQYDRRINYLYPFKGYRLFFNVKKEGLGIFNEQNSLLLRGGAEFFYELKEDFGLGTKLTGRTNTIRSQQAFANNTGLGYGNNLVSGYELYVMDGIDYFLAQNHIKGKLIEFDYNWPKFMINQFEQINVKLFLRFNFDFAYVNEPTYVDTNDLNNRWIYGYGPAIDLILYNSFLFSFEYSYNDIGEHGFYINTRNSF